MKTLDNFVYDFDMNDGEGNDKVIEIYIKSEDTSDMVLIMAFVNKALHEVNEVLNKKGGPKEL